jgi:hypothetical protein
MSAPRLDLSNRRRLLRPAEYRHHPNHRTLVVDRSGTIPSTYGEIARLDVVAVPASRRAENLREAAKVARLAGAHMLVLCSREANASAAHRIVTERLSSDQVTIVRLPSSWRIPGLRLIADTSNLVRARDSDTNTKRNLAIVVARRCGWTRLLFLDDDVRDIGHTVVRRAERLLADPSGVTQAVGWAFDDFPDNSIVCHAYRRAGGAQSTFIGGGALAIKVGPDTPFFPLMYNEDWLFMLPLMLRGPSYLAWAGCLRQVGFDPYRKPKDAVRQEAGDALAEGLFRLLHIGQPLERAMEPGYWKDALSHRRKMIVDVRDALRDLEHPDTGRAIAALDRALLMRHRATLWPVELSKWVTDWRADLTRWRSWLERLPAADSVEAALQDVGLDAYSPGGHKAAVRQAWRACKRAITLGAGTVTKVTDSNPRNALDGVNYPV